MRAATVIRMRIIEVRARTVDIKTITTVVGTSRYIGIQTTQTT
jgi:hypothetical protein